MLASRKTGSSFPLASEQLSPVSDIDAAQMGSQHQGKLVVLTSQETLSSISLIACASKPQVTPIELVWQYSLPNSIMHALEEKK